MANGRICYVEIPSTDVEALARSCEAVFGRRSPTRLGGGGDAYELFTDPAGNVFGLYQEPRR